MNFYQEVTEAQKEIKKQKQRIRDVAGKFLSALQEEYKETFMTYETDTNIFDSITLKLSTSNSLRAGKNLKGVYLYCDPLKLVFYVPKECDKTKEEEILKTAKRLWGESK